MISIRKHSGIFTLEVSQELPIRIDKAWEFFSSPGNLSKITPDHMGFTITSGKAGQMYPGQIITYVIGLFPGIRSSWVTEITHVKEKEFFVDEQRFGPYSMWHHEHHFQEMGNKTLMTDKVSYKIPFGFIGNLLHPVFIKPRLKKIFEYRKEQLRQKFG